MKIWKMKSIPDDYKSYNVVDSNDMDIINEKVDQGKLVTEWNPLRIESVDDAIAGDIFTFFGYATIPLINRKAKDIFINTYNTDIQMLPVVDANTGIEYYLVNILNIIDGIDYNQSKFKRLSFDIIVDVIEYVFKDIVRDVPIFKIDLDGGVHTTEVFVNDVFKKTVEDNNLKGFKFTEVYELK